VAGIAKKALAEIRFKEKRAIKFEEHQTIIARETNPERKAFYQLAWLLDASQSDLAFLEANNMDWENNVISYRRMKTKTIAFMRLDNGCAKF
jgi:hypothetical protein